MSKLDRYIIGKFLGTFAFMLGVFCLVVVVFDLMERLGRLIEHDAPLWDAALYYVNVCFHFAVQVPILDVNGLVDEALLKCQFLFVRARHHRMVQHQRQSQQQA